MSERQLDHPGRELFERPPADRVFLNSAYMSPKPRAVLAALHRSVDRLAWPNFGIPEFFEPPERVRSLLAKVVGGSAERFSLLGAVSQGTGLLAWNLRVGSIDRVGARRTILGVDGQFPSNVQPWRALESAGFRLLLVEGGDGATDRLLDRLDDSVALVATEPLSWTDGRRLDLARLLPAVRAAGALSLLDVTQSAGADPPLLDDLPVDVVVGAGYKWLLGPYGTAFLRLDAAMQESLEPLEWNWKNFEGSSDFNRLTEYRRDFASPAAKFDHGESSAFLRLPGFEAGLETLVGLGPGAVAEHGLAFARALVSELDGTEYRASDVERGGQAGHLFRVEPRRPEAFDPISVRLADAGVEVSRRAGGWRLSPHLVNDRSHVDRFLEALRA